MNRSSAARRVRRVATLVFLTAVVGASSWSLAIVQPASAQVGDPSPTTDPTPDPTPTPTPSPEPTPTPSPTPSPDPFPTSTLPPSPPHPGGGGKGGGTDGNHGKGGSNTATDWSGYRPSTSGAFSTAALDQVAARMRARGEAEELVRSIYRPFIVEGPAAWSDSWHAPRYAGGFHLHEGQDVLCRYGAPVLAAEAGRLEFGSNSLGGLVAYIRQADGGFLYYAHLSSWRDGWNGRQVVPGDVIGSCGASGDATVPHVHFGWYGPDGEARNPMDLLVGWLHTAERRSGVLGLHADPTIEVRSTGNELGSETPIVAPVVGSELIAPARAVGGLVPDGAPASVIANPLLLSMLVVGALIPSTMLSRRSGRRREHR